ncbi:hypothetical protein T484DRAFT_1988407, partial [Baffinella frigidus]
MEDKCTAYYAPTCSKTSEAFSTNPQDKKERIGSGGIVALITKEMADKYKPTSAHYCSGRILHLQIGQLHILAVYGVSAPTSQPQRQLQREVHDQLHELIRPLQHTQQNQINAGTTPIRIMLVGDINSASNPSLDRSSKKATGYDKSPHAITALLTSLGFIDMHRKRHPQSEHYSFYRTNKHDVEKPTTSRIDGIYLDAHTAGLYPADRYSSAIGCLPGPYTTDHRPVFVSFSALLTPPTTPTTPESLPNPRLSRWPLKEHQTNLYKEALHPNKPLGAEILAEIESWRTTNNALNDEPQTNRTSAMNTNICNIFQHLREAVQEVKAKYRKSTRTKTNPPDHHNDLSSLVDSWRKYSPNLLDNHTDAPPDKPQQSIPDHLKTSSHHTLKAHLDRPGSLMACVKKTPPWATRSNLIPVNKGNWALKPKALAELTLSTVEGTFSDKTILFNPAKPDTLGPWLVPTAFKKALTTQPPDSHPQLITDQEEAHNNVERVATNMLAAADILTSTTRPCEWSTSTPNLTHAATKVIEVGGRIPTPALTTWRVDRLTPIHRQAVLKNLGTHALNHSLS